MTRQDARILVDELVETRVDHFGDSGMGYASACGTLQELLSDLLSGLQTPAEVEARLREMADRRAA